MPKQPRDPNKPMHPRASEAKIVGPMADRIGSDGKRNLMLNAKERRVIQQHRKLQKIVAMMLDVEHRHSYDEIAAEVGISRTSLIDLTKSDEFIQEYNSQIVDISDDPMVKATRMSIASMAPEAARTLRSIMEDTSAPAASRVSAAKEVLRLSGITEPMHNKSDKSELQDFLRSANVQVDTMNISMPLPPGYEKVQQVIDGQLKDLPVQEAPETAAAASE